jgi:DVNP family
MASNKIYAINIEMADKMLTVGSKAQVFHGTAKHTSGGLTKKDLIKKKGRIISRRKSMAGKKAIKHLRSLGYVAKKGTFKLFHKSDVDGRKHRKTSKRHTRKRGGAAAPAPATSSMGSMSHEAMKATVYGAGSK